MRAMHGCVQAGNRLAQRVWLSAASHYTMRAELGGGSPDAIATRVVRRCAPAQRGASFAGPAVSSAVGAADRLSAAEASPVALAEFNAVRLFFLLFAQLLSLLLIYSFLGLSFVCSALLFMQVRERCALPALDARAFHSVCDRFGARSDALGPPLSARAFRDYLAHLADEEPEASVRLYGEIELLPRSVHTPAVALGLRAPDASDLAALEAARARVVALAASRAAPRSGSPYQLEDSRGSPRSRSSRRASR